MTVSVGSRFDSYEIVGSLGAGGMGEVYRARDRRLGREVAIKLLPASLASDPDRIERLEREARILASLNHPHIAGIHGVVDANGATALVLELVDGQTLDRLLASKPLVLSEALRIARQVAEALAAAHDRGIVHRDLKPSNIALTQDGTVKVLDFGLAKLASTPAMIPQAASTVHTVTGQLELSQVGGVVGTPAYMSPEQATGHEVDRRADVWAFGCVVFEMLHGKKAFDRATIQETLAAVVAGDIRVSPNVPSRVAELIHRCLQKDSGRRPRDLSDLALQIEEIRTTPRPASTPASRVTGHWWWLVTAAGALAGIVAGAWLGARPQSAGTARLAVAPTTWASSPHVTGYARDVAISPDGSRIVYVGGNGLRLFVRAIDRQEPLAIDGLGMPHYPVISPDGKWIVFFDGLASLKRVSIDGGAATILCYLRSAPTSLTWGPDETILFATANKSEGIQQVSTRGGTPVLLFAPQSDRSELFNSLQYIPERHALLFTLRGGPRLPQLAAMDLRTRQQTIVRGDAYDGRYLPTGHLLFGSSGTVNVARFDLAALQISGEPAPVQDRIMTTPYGGALNMDVSPAGTLVYIPESAGTARTLVWVDSAGREEETTLPPRQYAYPRVSPDGKRLALDLRDQENDLWLWSTTGRVLSRLTFDPGLDQYPVWMPDGQRLLFDSSREGTANLFLQSTDGNTRAERLATSPNPQFPYWVSNDGTKVVFREDSPETGPDLKLLTLPARTVESLVQTRFNELNADLSPDGRWLVYESNESGPYEIYVRPFPRASDGRWQVTTGGGSRPAWSKDGRHVFYVSPTGALMAVPVQTTPALSFGQSTVRLEGGYYVGSGINVGRTYDVAPDGRLLMVKFASSQPTALVVVQNWFSEVRRTSGDR